MILFKRKNWQIRLQLVYGPKQDPPDTDFHITPCLTYGYHDEKNLGWAKGVAIEWGQHALAIGLYYVYIDEVKRYERVQRNS